MEKTNDAIAVDLGSTNISAALLSGGKEVLSFDFKNPQTRFGADVMTRIQRCMDGQLEAMHQATLEGLLHTVQRARAAGYAPQKMVVSGNTVMLHILLNCDCTAMGFAPYTPHFTKAQAVYQKKLGLMLETLPCVAAFGGGDVVAGILSLENPPAGKKNVLIDLGTNAEIAVWDNRAATLTSAAAGNCFAAGKINGTTLIDVMATLLEAGAVDETGAIANGDTAVSFRILEKSGTLTQKRIREFQLAKAAVRAATEILLESENVAAEEIERVYIAGGFSQHISVKSAVRCGIFAKELEKKCVSVGNSSLQGAKMVANGKAKEAACIAKASRYQSLNDSRDFNEKFMEYMLFEG